jgi:hypothetical protein
MADPPPDTGTPRWVKVFGVIVAILILLFVIVLLFGGGEHGPGRHTPSGGAGGQAPLSSVTEDLTPSGTSGGLGGYTPPEGGHG